MQNAASLLAVEVRGQFSVLISMAWAFNNQNKTERTVADVTSIYFVAYLTGYHGSQKWAHTDKYTRGETAVYRWIYRDKIRRTNNTDKIKPQQLFSLFFQRFFLGFHVFWLSRALFMCHSSLTFIAGHMFSAVYEKKRLLLHLST